MMSEQTDRELLELAANAAGLKLHPEQCYGIRGRHIFDDRGLCGTRLWNPLTDDGDALRLAVTLRLDVEFHKRPGGFGVSAINYDLCGRKNMQGAGADFVQDEGWSTRRAIVRDAAEIGKSIKGSDMK
jgi:hypothetical protein